MRIIEVVTEDQKGQFRELPVRLFKGDPNFIRPLDKDIEQVFDPKQNKFFKKGEARRWLLLSDSGEIAGRLATFVNRQYKNEQPTGGIGFFDCIDDQNAANQLFDHAKAWLQERGMEAMDGPINFGERDRWWGLLVEGFEPPLFGMHYAKQYYKTLFENYGFRPYFYQLCFAMSVDSQVHHKHYERHAILSKDPGFRAEMIRKSELPKFVKDFTYIYNKAWAGHGGGKTLEEKQVAKMFQAMKPVIDEHISWFVYYKDEPVALWINLPDLNQWFRHLNGKFGLLQKLSFLWLKAFGKCDRFVGIVFGIIPEFQGKGVDAYIIIEAAKVIQTRRKYKMFEMQWIGDFNPKMVNISEGLGTHLNRKLATYRYLFDRSKEFQRHPMLA